MPSSVIESDVSALFKPLEMGPFTLRNRVAMSAMTRSRGDGNVPGDLIVEYYGQRAEGGAGLIVTEGVLVSQQGAEWLYVPGLWSSEQVAGWKKTTNAVHSHGAHIFAQLMHVGRLAHPDAPEHKAGGQPVWGPSTIAARGGKFRFIPGAPGYVQPAEVPDPTVLIEQYKQAIVNAKEAGFDGVEVHCGNGFLIHTFLDSSSNVRTDTWGGSIENRARFALEVLEAAVEVFGLKRVGIKVTPGGGYGDMGMPLDETISTYDYFLSKVDKLGLAYINLLRYLPALDPNFGGKPRGTPHDVLETYRPIIKNTPVALNGGLSPSEAVALVASGMIDIAMFGWLFLGHPDLAMRIEKGYPLDAVVDPNLLYGKGPSIPFEILRKGYTDFAFYTNKPANKIKSWLRRLWY